MSKNRDRLSIFAAILEAANSGASKTRIMFQANLSFKLLEKYLDATINAGFIKIDETSRYVLTDSGRDFLKQYKEYYDRYVRTQKSLDGLNNERKKLSGLCENPKLPDEEESISQTE